MSNTEHLIVTLPSDIAAAVQRTVAEGGYASVSDVVREALEDWVRQRADEAIDEGLGIAARIGIDSGTPLPAEAVFSELRARYTPQG